MTLTLMLLMAQAVNGGCDVQNRAEFRMHVWMNKLSLADWKIALQVVDAATLPSGEMGHSRMVLPAKTATISIPDRAVTTRCRANGKWTSQKRAWCMSWCMSAW